MSATLPTIYVTMRCNSPACGKELASKSILDEEYCGPSLAAERDDEDKEEERVKGVWLAPGQLSGIAGIAACELEPKALFKSKFSKLKAETAASEEDEDEEEDEEECVVAIIQSGTTGKLAKWVAGRIISL